MRIRKKNSRQADSFKYHCQIYKPFGGLDHCLDWCKKELKKDWRWELIDVSTDQRPGCYNFYFDNEKEFLAFIMRWQ